MLDTRIILSGLWVATMLTYLWGDVLRLFVGDMEPGTIGAGFKPTQRMWLFIAAFMLLPIIMVVLTLTLRYPMIRWLNIAVPILVVVFNLAGFSGYPAYNKLLLIVSFVFNAMTVWYAWRWVANN